MKKIAFTFILMVSITSFGQKSKPKSKPQNKPQVVQNIEIDPVILEPANYVTQDDNTVYTFSNVELQPEFPGGMKNLYLYVEKNIKIPDEIVKEQIIGKVYTSFVIEKDGSISDIKVIRDIGYGSGNEIVRVLKTMPKWIPAQRNGKNVRYSYTFPIKLNGTK